MKRFTKPFAPGEDRFEDLNIELTPNEQIIIPNSLAWLEASNHAKELGMIICSLGVNSIFKSSNLSSPGAKGFVNLFKGSLKSFSLKIFNANESPT